MILWVFRFPFLLSFSLSSSRSFSLSFHTLYPCCVRVTLVYDVCLPLLHPFVGSDSTLRFAIAYAVNA